MEIARLYRDAQRSFVELARTFDADDWAAAVPCCPGWTARDVLSHVVGLTLDVVDGNIEGAGTDPWTAAQVERWRDTPVAELIERWDDAIAPVSEAVEAFGEVRPPIDCHAHEHDLRHALGRPGNRDGELMRATAGVVGQGAIGRPVEVELVDGTTWSIPGRTSDPGPVVTATGLDRFEIVRSRLGRRAAGQVRAWAWSEPLTDDELSAWFVFGPAAHPIEE